MFLRIIVIKASLFYLQICLQTVQQQLKPAKNKMTRLTGKTRQTLDTSGFAGDSQGTHKTAKNLFVLLLSGRPLVRIQFGVPKRRILQNIGCFYNFSVALHFADLSGYQSILTNILPTNFRHSGTEKQHFAYTCLRLTKFNPLFPLPIGLSQQFSQQLRVLPYQLF